MAILGRKDLHAIFLLLALVYLFDSIASGYLPVGILVFLIIAIVVLFSERPESSDFRKNMHSKDNELVVRVSVILVFLGVLLGNQYVIALGFFVGMVLLFSSTGPVAVELLTLRVHSPGLPARPKEKRSRKPKR